MQRKKLPVGIEDFKEIRKEGFYYVDKTSLIRNLLNHWGKVNLFTRPRRFGKTLNMSMLKNFLEIGADKTLFDGLTISKETELCEEYLGKFPVIFLSLKDVDGLQFEDVRKRLIKKVGTEAERFRYMLDSDRLSVNEKAPDDKKENFYHGLLLGLLRSEVNWLILSIAESGDGFSDILIEPEDPDAGIVSEVKYPGLFTAV